MEMGSGKPRRGIGSLAEVTPVGEIETLKNVIGQLVDEIVKLEKHVAESEVAKARHELRTVWMRFLGPRGP